MRPVINPSTTHCFAVRSLRVLSQYHKNNAAVNAECACDQEGLKYMYTGSELAHQIASVARKAHKSPAYWRARRNASSSPRKPQNAVPKAIARRYGPEKPSAATCEPSARASSTPPCASNKKGAHSIAGPTVK